MDEQRGPGQTVVRGQFTVVDGALDFESRDGERHDLRPGEWLRCRGSRGTIRAIRLDADRLALTSHGYVRGMRTGSDDHPRNLVPTWLQRIRARHGLGLPSARSGSVPSSRYMNFGISRRGMLRIISGNRMMRISITSIGASTTTTSRMATDSLISAMWQSISRHSP